MLKNTKVDVGLGPSDILNISLSVIFNFLSDLGFSLT